MNILIISQPKPWTDRLISLLSDEDYNLTVSSRCDSREMEQINPDWVFFFHWSERISPTIYSQHKCVTIHTGRLPLDRGGSPLQNQILMGLMSTRVNLIETTDPMDSGGIYCSAPLTLQGGISDIWLAIATESAALIKKCVSANLKPLPQEGSPSTFSRVKNNKINFKEARTLSHIYDQIRMVDDESYPNPHVVLDGYLLEFSRPKFTGDAIISDVKITRK